MVGVEVMLRIAFTILGLASMSKESDEAPKLLRITQWRSFCALSCAVGRAVALPGAGALEKSGPGPPLGNFDQTKKRGRTRIESVSV
ncbi:hypothetical protein HPP92_017582 [Vanilla planifolia]|uniref:Uncharacterized protein n=1 Tax=Vanilla planifolia TaxID=51239 RepID=A0A835QL53_VANPL|nr:hypothetical protein HPP92_017582 [Vanilla planifolia]